ncbi:hypothetical protein Pmani_036823 [Petrolisthes manimaculis]|uniref:Uncharacterized protein n=1 Tax=Petrolisthes manimaculis TaxID=1843537 RepID=A0AAE1NKD2_9EUCA|nr:hypothetical protein Pmani_036823 [Petrolisthes manimaculis]
MKMSSKVSKDSLMFKPEWHPNQCRCKSCHHDRLMEQKVLDEFDEEMNHLEDEFQRTKVFTSTCQRYIEAEWPGEEVDDPKKCLAGPPGHQTPDQNCSTYPHWPEWDAQQVPDRMGWLRRPCLNQNVVDVDASLSYDEINGKECERHTILPSGHNDNHVNLHDDNPLHHNINDCIDRRDSCFNQRRRGSYDEGRVSEEQQFGNVNAAVYAEGRKSVKRSLTVRIKSSIKKRYLVDPSSHPVDPESVDPGNPRSLL